MLQQCLIPIDDTTCWNAQLENIPHAPAHLLAYQQAMMKSSKLQTYLYCALTKKFKTICPIAIRKKFGQFDIVTPYGFGGFTSIGTHPDFNQSWREYITDKGFVCGYIALHPLFDNMNFFPADEINNNNNIYILDLQQPIDTLFNQLAKGHRYELRKWERSPTELIKDHPELIKVLPSLYQETLTRVNATNVYHFSAETLFNLINNVNSIAIGAAVDGKIEAISLFLYTPYVAEYFLNASTLKGRYHTRGLLWAAIKILKNLQIPYLNLGGGFKPYDTLEAFKRRFGGTAYTCRVLKQVYDQTIFNRLCLQTGIMKNNNRHYFPPYYGKGEGK